MTFYGYEIALFWRAKHLFLDELPEMVNIADLFARTSSRRDPDLERLCFEYLPLTFSRRHGDPSRPWNKFSINLKNADGSQRLDYQGNWQDLFQNWEALTCFFLEICGEYDLQIRQRRYG